MIFKEQFLIFNSKGNVSAINSVYRVEHILHLPVDIVVNICVSVQAGV